MTSLSTTPSILNPCISFFLLLLHLGCFFITFPSKKRSSLSSPPPLQPPLPPPPRCRPLSSFLNHLKAFNLIFMTSKKIPPPPTPMRSQPFPSPPPMMLSSPLMSPSSFPSLLSPKPNISTLGHSQLPPKRLSKFRLNEIFPCAACGLVFAESSHLDYHQSTRHAITELSDRESASNVVRIIFQTGWTRAEDRRSPTIHRILKIHNSPKIAARFEEYREAIKIKSSRSRGSGHNLERCIVDGNELLGFHCSTFVCSLGVDGSSGLCGHDFCSICGIIRSGFSPKLDGISTMSTSRGAHKALPEEIEEEFAFMNARRAMLVCRVVAGRVAPELGAPVSAADKEDCSGFDSIDHDGEELLVFNPRAVLPCFVIVYSF